MMQIATSNKLSKLFFSNSLRKVQNILVKPCFMTIIFPDKFEIFSSILKRHNMYKKITKRNVLSFNYNFTVQI